MAALKQRVAGLRNKAGTALYVTSNSLLVAVLWLISLTPIVFFPDPLDVRQWLYRRLAGSRPFASSGNPPANTRSLGMMLWDWTRVYSVVFALLVLPVAAPVTLGVWLVAISSDSGVSETVSIVQAVVSALVGGVAIDVFLAGPLQRLGQPRVACTFLLGRPGTQGDRFVERYETTEDYAPGQLRWVHLRLTNVGVIYYQAFTVSCEIPEGWVVPQSFVSTMGSDQPYAEQLHVAETGEYVRMATYAKALTWKAEKRQIDFESRSDPRDTGPGATAVYSLLLRAPPAQEGASYRLRVKISASEAGGTAIRDLTLRVRPPTG